MDAALQAVAAAGTDGTRRYLQLVSADSNRRATLTGASTPRSGARTGSPLRVAVDVERRHFFDAETEEAHESVGCSRMVRALAECRRIATTPATRPCSGG